MSYRAVKEKLNAPAMNRNGFTFLTAIFMVMIVGILSAFTGKTWTMIMKREREKELIFRGSQIKEAIENWNNPKYSVRGLKWAGQPHPLADLSQLFDNPHVLGLKYLPPGYATELDGKDPRCAPDCPKLKVYQDPMTGKEWTLIRGNLGVGQPVAASTGAQGGGIIGIASKSEEAPLRTNFKDTALENMLTEGQKFNITDLNKSTSTEADSGSKTSKYSDWKFVADPKNDHTKIYRAYHEGW